MLIKIVHFVVAINAEENSALAIPLAEKENSGIVCPPESKGK